MLRFYREALKFIHETIDVSRIKNDYPVIVIDDEFINKIKAETGTRRFYDLLFAVKNYVKEISDESIVERVNRIVKEWNDRTRDVEELYNEALSIAEIINEQRKEREELKLNEKEYGVFRLIRSHLTEKINDEEIVGAIQEIMERVNELTFPMWFEKSEIVQKVEREILLYLLEKLGGKLDDLKKTRNEIVRFLVNRAEREARRWG